MDWEMDAWSWGALNAYGWMHGWMHGCMGGWMDKLWYVEDGCIADHKIV